jgi:hypothetical protein
VGSLGERLQLRSAVGAEVGRSNVAMMFTSVATTMDVRPMGVGLVDTEGPKIRTMSILVHDAQATRAEEGNDGDAQGGSEAEGGEGATGVRPGCPSHLSVLSTAPPLAALEMIHASIPHATEYHAEKDEETQDRDDPAHVPLHAKADKLPGALEPAEGTGEIQRIIMHGT